MGHARTSNTFGDVGAVEMDGGKLAPFRIPAGVIQNDQWKGGRISSRLCPIDVPSDAREGTQVAALTLTAYSIP
jgi:hypothetical protein